MTKHWKVYEISMMLYKKCKNYLSLGFRFRKNAEFAGSNLILHNQSLVHSNNVIVDICKQSFFQILFLKILETCSAWNLVKFE